MKNKIVSLIFSFIFSINIYSSSASKVVDCDVARVNGVSILKSHIDEARIDLNGEKIMLSELIDEELMIQKAREFGISVSGLELTSRVSWFKDSNKMSAASDEEWTAWLKERGLTQSRLERQMYRTALVTHLKKNILPDTENYIDSKKVENFYKENPEYQAESFELKAAFLTNEESEKLLKERRGIKFDWIDLGVLTAEKLSEKMKFVSRMPEGSICKPFESGNGKQVVKMVKRTEKRIRSLDERTKEIGALLGKKDHEERSKNFLDQLRNEASIIKLSS
jgi:parvulin-like peptidyl-prolyl isomerase